MLNYPLLLLALIFLGVGSFKLGVRTTVLYFFGAVLSGCVFFLASEWLSPELSQYSGVEYEIRLWGLVSSYLILFLGFLQIFKLNFFSRLFWAFKAIPFKTVSERKRHLPVLLSLLFCLSLGYLSWDFWRIQANLLMASGIRIERDMGWPEPFRAIINHLKETTNKRLLIKILLSHPDRNFAVEGMLLIVEEQPANAEELLRQHLNDRSVNDRLLVENGHFARLSILALKIKQSRALTTEEETILREDRRFIQSVFQINQLDRRSRKVR
ncbi:MAG: hypothetical protein ACPGVO_04040 [Spirulinaceae cyanobacterium]